MALFMVLSLVYIGAPAAYATVDSSAPGEVEKQVRAADSYDIEEPFMPDEVFVFIEAAQDTKIAEGAMILVDYWRERFPDTVFTVSYHTGTNGINDFIAGADSNTFTILISNPADASYYYQGLVDYNISDPLTFKPVCFVPGTIQPRSMVLLARADDDRFDDFESLYQYIKEHPGEIRIGAKETSVQTSFIKNTLDVLGIDSSEITFHYASASEVNNGLTEELHDIISLEGSAAAEYIEKGYAKGIFHNVFSREGYPYNIESLASIQILPEVSILSDADKQKLVFDLPVTAYVHGDVSDEFCYALNRATAGILDDEDYMQRIKDTYPAYTFQDYSLEQLAEVHRKVDGQMCRAFYYDKEQAAYPIWFNLYDEGWMGGDPPTIQVTDLNKSDILGDGGSIKYDSSNMKLTFSDPDFGSSMNYDNGGEYAALIVGDTGVTLTGSAYIPTIYSAEANSTIVFAGDFRMGVMYGALCSKGYVVVQPEGSIYAGCNGTPMEVKGLIVYGGKVETDSPMGTSLNASEMIRITGGSVTATGGPNYPSIYSGGYIAVNGLADSVKASVFTFPGDDTSNYENMGDLACRIIALEGITLDGIAVIEPAGGKVSEIEYHTYDEYGNLQPCSAYGITRPDGRASAVVELGEMNVEITPAYSATVTMNENFNLNLYVRDIPEEYASWFNVVWTFDGGFFEKNLGELTPQTGGQYPGSYKVMLANVFSYQMTKPFDIEVYRKGVEDGPVKEINYSVQKYFVNQYNKTSDALFKQIYGAALDYGAAAQLYFNGMPNPSTGQPYDTDVNNLANKTTNPDFTINANKPTNKAAKSGAITGMDDKMTATLIFGSETSIKIYFKYSGDINGLTITADNGKTVTAPELGSDGRYSVKIEGIRSFELYKDYTITFTAGSGASAETRTVTYSAYAYAANKWNSDDANLSRLVKALVAYGELARQKWQ